MQTKELPSCPPKGQIRYKAVYVERAANPFRGRGPLLHTRIADVDEDVPIQKVKEFARDMSEDYIFVRLEVVAEGK